MRKRSLKAVTLVELMVTTSIIGLVAGVTVSSVSKVRASCRATECLSNQKQISHALQMFYNDHRVFPSDGESASLRVALKDYIDSDAVLRCPCDTSSSSTSSYLPYYVRRFQSDGDVMFTLGCPRHHDCERGPSLFDNGSACVTELGKVQVNGQEVRQDAPADVRTMDSGQMAFEDKSTVDVVNASADYAVTVVESFRLGDGTLYTVVRVRGDGKIDCKVTPGSKFEVVTPSAIVGVRGTRFTVETLDAGSRTETKVINGKVWVMDTVTGRTRVLKPGQTVIHEDPSPGCMHCPKHCKSSKKKNKSQGKGKGKGKGKKKSKEKHCKKCPLHPKYGS